MNAFSKFSNIVTTAEDLERITGSPLPQILAKELNALDRMCRDFIATSPFCLIASANPDGYLDISPRGDPAGFVQVVSDTLIAIPDRPGNKRVDTFHNVLKDPRVSVIFFVPGKMETLRLRGEARICADPHLLAEMAVGGHPPKLALLIHVETAFAHCPKCVIRANLWQPEDWPDASNLPNMNAMMVKHARIKATPDEWFETLKEKGELDLY
ncbi:MULTISPECIES: MSMEG_1061 family FMN-dependent PPOX-type flavoprotein [unclassified Ruegeria]|uniref:MSMEG_1061 family FMN-dependent PPOX-type flavoprotein n=1 Tax=unclassified Ruegeria TaxID=2625375 RepID=UPI001487DA84|nr:MULTISPECIES: MSMEG_1061 family FMN-dependent PPOX-type flavoprotein [unclassified Ruegeria]NOD34245.1 pyridoxamine 5'-phosphate oxidase family protein [Ruegeria sp. HKCCD7296]NOE41269.1 pyridoxamine 5'-phosphate oxidase family protein [Ruegeria sp. HKCCD7319]